MTRWILMYDTILITVQLLMVCGMVNVENNHIVSYQNVIVKR